MSHTLSRLLVFLGICLPLQLMAAPSCTLRGVVLDSYNREPLSFATVRLTASDGVFQGVITGVDGDFSFENLKQGTYQISVSYVGYDDQIRQITIPFAKPLVFLLQSSSNLLNEVVVTASESKGITSASKIDKTAMEHLQPTSISDLIALIPGGSTQTPDMTAPNTIHLREVGLENSDYSTSSLGTSFVIDGSPISTDAQMQYVSSEINSSFENKTSVNSGVDMRSISTDNIESVEIVRGIPSVEYGDLTSGVVIINRKQKPTPFEARFKADQYSKLISVGKGVEWTGRQLVFSADGGFLSSQSDPRNPLNNYKRINLSARFQKKWNLARNHSLTWNTDFDYSGNIDANKVDPEINSRPEDKFRSSYHSLKWHNKLKWKSSGQKMFRYMDFDFTSSYSKDLIKRSKFVQPNGSSLAVTQFSEGVFDENILLHHYTANLKVDGQPFSIFSNLKAVFKANAGITKHHFFVGASWKYAKNFGGGQIYDMSRPLNPFASSQRPRSYREIPASSQFSLFAEERMNLALGEHELELQAGLRSNTLLNINRAYQLHGKVYLDPRANLQWKFPKIYCGSHGLSFSLSGGVGSLTKMPTLLQLYPDLVYLNFVQLRYNSKVNQANVRTYVANPINYDLKPARNFKWEARFGVEYDNNVLSVTYFREKMSSGFRNIRHYSSYAYRKYNHVGLDFDLLTPENREAGLIPYEDRTILDGYRIVNNGSTTEKEGVEFQFSSKRIPKINTRFTVNGAWLRSIYRNTIPVFDPVSDVIGQIPVSDIYVGQYQNDDNYLREQFNTNFIVDTWLEKIGMKVSATLECMWFKNRQSMEVSGIPLAYMDHSGDIHPYTEADKTDFYKQHLVKTFGEAMFKKWVEPFYLYVNFKVTKDFGKHFSISLFADRILDYVPDYVDDGYEIRRSALPSYFGMELNFRL